jgi:hypothetical protein
MIAVHKSSTPENELLLFYVEEMMFIKISGCEGGKREAEMLY